MKKQQHYKEHEKRRIGDHNKNINYTYWRWDEESQRTLPTTITAGQDSVTEEHITMLNDLNHATELGERYEEENRYYKIT